jgi:glycoside/pentoside/hexuronide:cation symporter, GPH family
MAMAAGEIVAQRRPPPLTVRLKAFYGLGSTAEALSITASSSFLLIFYNQVRGLPAEHVGLALSLGLFVNAVFDPLVGSWSDRTRSRYGRRHPFMFASVIPAGLLFFAVFNPPHWSELGQLIWLGVCNTALLQAMTLYHTPHLALGGEMADGYLERTSIMAYNTFCLWAGDTMAWLLSYRLFFGPGPGQPNGALIESRYPLFATAVGVAIAGILMVSSWATRSRIPFLKQVAPEEQHFDGRRFLRDIGRTLTNRNYVVLLLGLAFASLMSGVRLGLGIYVNSYYWRLTNDQISLFVIASFAGYLFAALVVRRLHDRLDKRWTGALSLCIYCIGPVIPLLLGMLGLLSPATPGLVWILIGFALLQHIPYSLMTTTIYSALADIADELELKHGMRQEGILYSTRTFFARVDQALGTALAGLVLGLVAFPAHATPGAVAQPVLDNLVTALLLSTIPGLIAAGFYAMLRVTRASHDATRAALDARTAAAE